MKGRRTIADRKMIPQGGQGNERTNSLILGGKSNLYQNSFMALVDGGCA